MPGRKRKAPDSSATDSATDSETDSPEEHSSASSASEGEASSDTDSEVSSVELSDSEVSDVELSEEEFDEQGYKIGDSADYDALMAMNEVNRETILYERVEERKARMSRREAVRAAGQADKKSARSAKKKKSARGKRQKASRDKAERKKGKRSRSDALKDLRDRQKGRGGRRAYEDEDSDDDMSGDEGSDSYGEQNAGNRHKRRRAKRYEDSSDEYEDGVGDVGTPLRVQDVKQLQLRRIQLEKIVSEAFMTEYVKGMFARVSVGMSNGAQKYRCCRIVGVVPYKKSYTFGGVSVKSALLLKIGKGEKLWPFAQLSNRSVTEEEVKIWVQFTEQADLDVPSAEQALALKKKKDNLRKNFVYTPEVVAQLLKDKEAVADDRFLTKNLMLYKMKLQAQLEIAQGKSQFEESTRLQTELTAVIAYEDEQARRLNQEKITQIERINKKHSTGEHLNFQRGFRKQEKLRKAGKARYDPTQRNLMRPVPVFTVKKTAEEDAKAAEAKAAEAENVLDAMDMSSDEEEAVEAEIVQTHQQGSRLTHFTYDRSGNVDCPTVQAQAQLQKLFQANLHVDLNHVPLPSSKKTSPPPPAPAAALGGNTISISDYWSKRMV